MNITTVETIPVRIPLRSEFMPAGAQGEAAPVSNYVLVRVHTDAGIIGVGEVDSAPEVVKAVIDAPGSHAIASGLRHVLIGRDPLDTDVLWDAMYGDHRTRFCNTCSQDVHDLSELTRAEAILRKIFSNAPVAVKFALDAANKGLEMSQSEGLSLEASYFGLCAGTEDKKEGTTAFLEKRAPQFQGR